MNEKEKLASLLTNALNLGEPEAMADYLLARGVTVQPDTSDLVNINTATLADLRALPGLGNTLASRVYDWRRHKGPYGDIKELLEVPGFGPVVLERIQDKICI